MARGFAFQLVFSLMCVAIAAGTARAQTAELSTAYVTAQIGADYATLLGGRDFGWRYTYPYGDGHVGMLRFDHLGSGMSPVGGVRLVTPVSSRFGLILSVQDVRLMTTATETHTLSPTQEIVSTAAVNNVKVAYQNLWQYTNAEVLLRHVTTPWMYTFAGADVAVLADDSFDGVQQLLSDGSYYSYKTQAATGDKMMQLNSYYSVKYYEPIRVAAKFGVGTMLPMPYFHSWVMMPELAFSIPITPLFDAHTRSIYQSEGVGMPNMFYTSFTVSFGLPVSEPAGVPGAPPGSFGVAEKIATPISNVAPKNEKPAAPQLRTITGSIHEQASELPLAATITATDLASGKAVATSHADNSGHFSIALGAPGKYSITAEAPQHLFHSVALTLAANDDDNAELAPIELANTTHNAETSVPLLVFFGFDNAMLSAESYPELARVTALLKASPDMEIEIAGHTDAEGSDEYNQQLSAKRALAVKNYLVLQGISVRRITSAGYGKSKPIASNGSEEGRAQNRRVEMVIKGRSLSDSK